MRSTFKHRLAGLDRTSGSRHGRGRIRPPPQAAVGTEIAQAVPGYQSRTLSISCPESCHAQFHCIRYHRLRLDCLFHQRVSNKNICDMISLEWKRRTYIITTSQEWKIHAPSLHYTSKLGRWVNLTYRNHVDSGYQKKELRNAGAFIKVQPADKVVVT